MRAIVELGFVYSSQLFSLNYFIPSPGTQPQRHPLRLKILPPRLMRLLRGVRIRTRDGVEAGAVRAARLWATSSCCAVVAPASTGFRSRSLQRAHHLLQNFVQEFEATFVRTGLGVHRDVPGGRSVVALAGSYRNKFCMQTQVLAVRRMERATFCANLVAVGEDLTESGRCLCGEAGVLRHSWCLGWEDSCTRRELKTPACSKDSSRLLSTK